MSNKCVNCSNSTYILVVPCGATWRQRWFEHQLLARKNADGELYLYMAMPAVKEGKGEKESRYYLKGVFPSDTTRREIESRALEAYMR